MLSTSILVFNQHEQIKSNQHDINVLEQINKKDGKKIEQLNTINTTYEKTITGYKEKLNKKEINIKNKDKKIRNIKNELRKTKLKLKRESIVRQTKLKNEKSSKSYNMEVTAYQSYCSEGCTGVTATGYNVSNTTSYNGMRIIATDPNIIPLYSIVKIELKSGESFQAIALDTGGGINGYIIDYLVSSENEAIQFGRQQAKVTVLRSGE